MNLPPEPLPTPFLVRSLMKSSRTAAEAHDRDARDCEQPPATPPALPFIGAAATPLVQPPPGELEDWVYQSGPGQTTNKVYALGSAATTSSTAPGPPTTYIPFQSSKALTQTVALNAVEEWTIVNMNNIRHPFHIHVNPIYVVAVNGKPIEPFWADTIPLPYSNESPTDGLPGAAATSITFRTRFLHYTGRYVMHCHMLVHEDMGMMQGVTVV
jgi:FtsP/CotA-like multicopper oxidase with cupredoxin domain